MTVSLKLLLVILALVFFALSAAGVGTGRFGLVPAGLFCWLLSTVVS